MKIYNKVVIDMSSEMVIEEDSFEYNGDLALCGGPGAGGGGSVSVEPLYLTDYREMMDGTDTDSLTTSLVGVINTAVASGGNPYDGEAAYDPNAELDEMQERHDSFDEAVAALDYDADWEAIIETTKGKLSSVGLSTSDDLSALISSIVSEAVTHAASNVASVLATAKTDVDGIIDDVIPNADGLIDTVINDSNTDAKTIVDANVIKGKTLAEDIKNKVIADVKVDTNIIANLSSDFSSDKVADEFTTAKTAARDATSSDYNAAKAAVRSAVATEYSLAKIAARSAGIVDYNSAKTSAKNSADSDFSSIKTILRGMIDSDFSSAKTITDTNIQSIVDSISNFATSKISTVINMAMSTASQNNSALDTLRTAFETRKTKSHMRSLGRFAATMADVNAVNGNSGFVMGLAMLEDSFQDTLDLFDAENAWKNYQLVFPSYVESFHRLFDAQMEGYLKSISDYINTIQVNNSDYIKMTQINSAEHLESIRSDVAGYLKANQIDMAEYLKSIQIDSSAYMQSFIAILPSYLSAYVQMIPNYLKSYELALPQYLNSVNGLTDLRTKISAALGQAQANMVKEFTQTSLGVVDSEYKSHLQAQVNTDLQFRDNKIKFISGGADQVVSMMKSEFELDYQALHTQAEIDRMKIVAFSEQYVQDLQIDVGDARWDLEVYQYGANMLGSFHGGTVTNPQSTTKTQSVLGGAMAGASIGATTGQPMMIGIGAAVGGLAGLMM